MAKIIQKNNTPSPEPEPNNSFSTFIAALLFILGLIGIGVFIFTSSFISIVLGILMLFISTVTFLSTTKNETPAFSTPGKIYGDMGERKTGFILEHCLPDEYRVIQNSIVTYNGEKSEIDNIVIGKSGVFIIEVKNMKGKIFGDYKDKNWTQYKIDQYNIEHQKEFYNPVKQVGTHIYRLANYMRDNRIFTNINGAVYFANSNSDVKLTGEHGNIPVFNYASTRKMIDYITNGDANLSDKTINRIIELLNREM